MDDLARKRLTVRGVRCGNEAATLVRWWVPLETGDRGLSVIKQLCRLHALSARNSFAPVVGNEEASRVVLDDAFLMARLTTMMIDELETADGSAPGPRTESVAERFTVQPCRCFSKRFRSRRIFAITEAPPP